MSRIIIEDTVGNVVIQRNGEKKKVSAERFKKNRTVQNEDTIITGEDSYALGVKEFVATSNPISIDIFPNSKVQLITKVDERKVLPKKGMVQLFTNWPIGLPFTEITYTHEKYGYSDDSIFMIEKKPETIIIASHVGSTPIKVKNTILNKEVTVNNYQQAVLTRSSIQVQDVDEKYRKAFRTVRDKLYEQIDEVVNQQLLRFFKHLCQFQEKMAGGLEWAINLMTKEELVDYINTWEKNLRKSLKDLPAEIQDEGEKAIQKALAEWEEHRKHLLELKFSKKDKKLYGMEAEEYLDLINEIKEYLPQEIYEENIRVYEQYQKIINRAQKEDSEIEKSAPKQKKDKKQPEPKKEPTELELQLQKLDQEIEEGLGQLEQEIEQDKTPTPSTIKKKKNNEKSSQETDEFSEEKLAKLVKEIEEK